MYLNTVVIKFSRFLDEGASLGLGTNLVLGPPEKFYRQGFLTFLGFDKNSTEIVIWLSYPHFLADFQV